jgi:hypothetical protein
MLFFKHSHLFRLILFAAMKSVKLDLYLSSTTELLPALQRYNEVMRNRSVDLELLRIRVYNYDKNGSMDPFIGFFESCRNIKMLSIHAYLIAHFDFMANLRKFFFFFTQVEVLELVIFACFKLRPNDLFDLIVECCPCLRDLRIHNNWKEATEKYFQGSDLKIGYYVL